tara:strand:- start:7775 stop:8368 length:594 start_codon:yes stop_codon:yes gene_type:complete
MHRPLVPLPLEFYQRETADVAKALLGKVVIHESDSQLLSGRIVEVEAYGGKEDPASHAHRNKTSRNSVMFGRPGCAYIYFIYGTHYCLNVVAHDVGVPGAALIRALEPLDGIALMKKNRGIQDTRQLMAGPGRLTKALNIGIKMSGVDLTRSRKLLITEDKSYKEINIDSSPRIGIRVGMDRAWRFNVRGNQFVSRR